MNLAIFLKTARDSAMTVLLAGLGTIGFVILGVWAMQSYGKDLLDFLSRFEFLRKMFEISLGIRVEGEVSSAVLYSIFYSHLVVLVLGWGSVIAAVSRVTAGEVEQGTADLLYALPVRRSSVFLSTTVVWVLAAVWLAFCPLLGILAGITIFPPPDRVHLSAYVPVSCNFLALYLAIGGLTSLAGVLWDRRGVVVGVVLTVAMVSAALNFIEPFLPSLNYIRYVGLLHWFRPADSVRLETWPVVPIVVLSLTGLLCWLPALAIHSRRDFPAV